MTGQGPPDPKPDPRPVGRRRFGPGRGELKLRLAISLAGLALMAYALARHGAAGLASFELLIFGCLFFGGSAAWSAWRLVRRG